VFRLNHDLSCSCPGTVSHVNVFTAFNMPFPVTASLSFDERFFWGASVFSCVWGGEVVVERSVPKVTQTQRKLCCFLTHDTKRRFREVLFWVNETKRDHTTLSYHTTLITHKSELLGLQDPDYLSSILGDFLWVFPHQN